MSKRTSKSTPHHHAHQSFCTLSHYQSKSSSLWRDGYVKQKDAHFTSSTTTPQQQSLLLTRKVRATTPIRHKVAHIPRAQQRKRASARRAVPCKHLFH